VGWGARARVGLKWACQCYLELNISHVASGGGGRGASHLDSQAHEGSPQLRVAKVGWELGKLGEKWACPVSSDWASYYSPASGGRA
jgi:hypothetical protein